MSEIELRARRLETDAMDLFHRHSYTPTDTGSTTVRYVPRLIWFQALDLYAEAKRLRGEAMAGRKTQPTTSGGNPITLGSQSDDTTGVGEQVQRQHNFNSGHRLPAHLETHSIDWVIVGSESGPNARPCDIGWVRSIRDQCVAASIPLFWKQHIEAGRKISTPQLDGRTWTEFPK